MKIIKILFFLTLIYPFVSIYSDNQKSSLTSNKPDSYEKEKEGKMHYDYLIFTLNGCSIRIAIKIIADTYKISVL